MLPIIFLNFFNLIVDVVTHYCRKYSRRIRPRAQLRVALHAARDYAQYEDIALRLDYEIGNDVWRRNPQSRKYDHRLIAERLTQLRRARMEQDDLLLLDLLRSGLLRNLANISDKQLYSRSYLGTKLLIQDYISEVLACLEYIRSTSERTSPSLTSEKKLQFFRDTRHSYGLSALVLQGGASFGMFHLGIVRALWEQRLLPTVISGTAIGALIAALACIATDEELPPLLYGDSINLQAFSKRGSRGQTLRKIKRFFRDGYILDISVLGELCRDNIGDFTFEEAFLRTNKVLNITIHGTAANSVPVLLNYLTAPNVLIWSAALASNALPGLYEPVELLCKDSAGTVVPWAPYGGVRFARSSDGETPLNKISELFNVNNFIVSQARPYLAPFLSSPLHRHHRRGWYLKGLKVIGLELSHRINQLSLFGIIPMPISAYMNAAIPAQSEITLVPSLALRDFFKLFRHPTHREIQYWVHKGERAVWPAVSLLRVRSLVEHALRDCFEEAREAERSYHGVASSRHATSKRTTNWRLPSPSSHAATTSAASTTTTTTNGMTIKRSSRKRSRTVDQMLMMRDRRPTAAAAGPTL